MSFVTGYFLGQEAARQEQSFKQLADAVYARLNQNHAEPTELDVAYHRIAELEADLANFQQYAQWAGPEIERLRDQVTRLGEQVSGLAAQIKHLETLEEIRRILRDDGNAD